MPPFRPRGVTEIPLPVPLGAIDPEAREVIERSLTVARERLSMDISWLAEFSGERKVFRVVEGDRDEWGVWEDSWLPVSESFCMRMLGGLIPNAIPDVAAEPAVADLDVTQRLGIGAYIGVPLVLPNGEVRGAFCCARHEAHPDLDDRDVRFMQVLARLAADELAFREQLREVRRLDRRLAGAEALAAALEARDHYTGTHSVEVVGLAAAVARRLGLDDAQVADVEQVALLHDIGKVAISDAILQKPAALDDDELAVMREHPALGARILEAVSGLSHLAAAVRAEHERWDGLGYPDGLAGEAIPVEARITFVCDSYHAMISDRPYRTRMPAPAAVAELQAHAGTMFWPPAVEALVAELGEPGG